MTPVPPWAARMAAIEEAATAVAHGIRNPLANI